MITNRLEFIPREECNGLIEGIDFGPVVWIIARSPCAVLMWQCAYSYSINGFRKYAEPGLYGLPGRNDPRHRLDRDYKHIAKTGRMTHKRIFSHAEAIRDLFDGDNDIPSLCSNAIRMKKTLLIEGGGPPLAPARKLGRDAYTAWRTLSETGFYHIEDPTSQKRWSL